MKQRPQRAQLQRLGQNMATHGHIIYRRRFRNEKERVEIIPNTNLSKMKKINIKQEDRLLCEDMAKEACIGGRSNIRRGKERSDNLWEDNYIGQIGNLAGCVMAYGYEKGLRKYKEVRALANQNKYKGDGGSDIIGWKIDFKCSRVRKNGKSLDSYNCLVRPRERHDNCIYFQFLIKDEDVYYMGWISESELPTTVETDGPFKGAFKIRCSELNQGYPPKELILKSRV